MSSTNGWGPVERDKSNGDLAANDGGVITLNGTPYTKGLGVHSASDVRYALNGTCTLLTAVVGVDAEVGSNGSIVFQVLTDGVQRFDSGVMTGATASKNVSVDLSGATQLALIVTDGGDGANYDHGDWADAQITCGADTTPPTVTTVTPSSGSTAVPITVNVTATFSEAMLVSSLTPSSHAGAAGGIAAGRDRELRRGEPHRYPRPDRQPDAERALHGNREERRIRRQGPGRQCSGQRSGVDVHDRRGRDAVVSE